MIWIIRIYTYLLLTYTGWRTYDFMSTQLPDTDTGMIIALLFLLATEIGMIIWHEASMHHVTTDIQLFISTTLMWIDFFGATGAGIADMILRQTVTADFVIPERFATILVYGLPVAVALNVAGALLFISNDADTQLSSAKRSVKLELLTAALKEIRSNKTELSNEMLPEMLSSLLGRGKLKKDVKKTLPAIVKRRTSTFKIQTFECSKGHVFEGKSRNKRCPDCGGKPKRVRKAK